MAIATKDILKQLNELDLNNQQALLSFCMKIDRFSKQFYHQGNTPDEWTPKFVAHLKKYAVSKNQNSKIKNLNVAICALKPNEIDLNGRIGYSLATFTGALAQAHKEQQTQEQVMRGFIEGLKNGHAQIETSKNNSEITKREKSILERTQKKIQKLEKSTQKRLDKNKTAPAILDKHTNKFHRIISHTKARTKESSNFFKRLINKVVRIVLRCLPKKIVETIIKSKNKSISRFNFFKRKLSKPVKNSLKEAKSKIPPLKNHSPVGKYSTC